MPRSNRLVLAHLWFAFVVFAAAAVLGAWQMWVRSPLHTPYSNPETYFISVTAHGTAMAYVMSTFFIMGFGYYVAETALGRVLPGRLFAWAGFALGVVGTVMAIATVLSGRATVMYTFYPPLTASPFYYIGVVLVVVGSWVWCVLMIAAMIGWKRANPGQAVPLAHFATVANAIMWLWTTVGVATEVLFLILPAAFGWTDTVDAGLARTLYSWTLHAIVYFWLLPAYIAFYTMAPQEAGGRLYSDTMARISFVLFILYSVPVGIHHLFMDPEQATGFKYLQSFLTGLVAIPTLLTIFTISASFEVAGRLRGGTGRLGWLRAVPWDRPMVLATGLAFVMLWFGGGGGLVNMSYGMNALIHNTAWVTAHFHLIFGGAVVIMYFAIAYEMWPRITGKPLLSKAVARMQLWLWFWGMLITTIPWHIAGLLGQPRRVAIFDYSLPMMKPIAPLVVVSAIGGLILLASAILLIVILIRSHFGERVLTQPLQYALAV
ncbi:MAG TPA: cbb3-type cytochrome c oxidase subunit I, partial [Pseudomonadota bacterium]|nr:cbb3-type cytochrome c oxidase subunit I [Pseudomonadota bacterium]